jgi:limonene-1,2-epoxide hydrolase
MTGSFGVHSHIALQAAESLSGPILLSSCPSLNIKFPKSKVEPNEIINPMLLKEYTMQENESTAKSAKEIVMEFIQALERKDFRTVRSYISDNISVLAPGPVDVTSFNKAEPFVTYLEHANLPPLDIKKEFADTHDVCLLYEMTYHDPPLTTFVCGWFHVNDDDGKISSLRFVMDPRQLFQQKKT